MIKQSMNTDLTNKLFFGIIFLILCVALPMFFLSDFYIIPFALILGIVGIFLIIFKPFYGLLIYTVFLLVRPQEFISALEYSPIPLEKSIAALLILSVIIKLKQKGFKFRFNKIDYSLFAFIVITLLSVTTAIWVSYSFQIWNKVLRLFIIYLLIVQIIDTKKELKIFIMLAICSSFFHASAAIINYYLGGFITNIAMGVDRAVGIDKSFSAPNSLAATMVYTLPFIYFYFIGTNAKAAKLFLFLSTPVLLWCIILTGSRTGMAGVIFFALVLIWTNKNKIRNMAMAVLILVLLWFAMPDQYQNRFLSTTDISSNMSSAASARGRIVGLVTGVKMAIDRPLLGYGVGGFPTASATIYNPNDWHDAHSLYGQILGELGILGTMIFVIWIYYMFVYIKKLQYVFKKKPDKFLYATIVGIKVQIFCLFFLGLAAHNLYRYNLFIVAALIAIMLKPEFMGKDKLPESEPEIANSPKPDNNPQTPRTV